MSRGLREIKRVQLAKEEQARKAEGKLKGKDAANSTEETDPGAEKARLLQSESRNSLTHGESLENLTISPRRSEGQEERGDSEAEVVTQAFTTPGADSPVASNFAIGTSEKSRGKMKERRSPSLEIDSSLDRVAAAGVGRNGFVPTQEWVSGKLVFN